MKIKLKITEITSKREKIIAEFIKDTIDAFMEMIKSLDECCEEEEK